MPTKNGTVDHQSHFNDDTGKHWHLTGDHEGVVTYTEMNLDEYQGENVAVEYGFENGHWLGGVTSIRTT